MKKQRTFKKKKEAENKNSHHSRFEVLNKYMPLIIIIASLLLTLVLVKTAWLCDDAFITLRTIDNFVHGYGLRYNIIERVMAYTHPLWLFLLAIPYYFFRDPFYTPILISILLTLLSVFIVVYKISSSKFNSFLFISLLIVSKSFVDYSTSGLENVLSHLISVIFIYVYLKDYTAGKKILFLSFITSAAILNRMDTALIYLPLVIQLLIQSKNKKYILLVLYGIIPIIIWTIFSIIYYGYPFPNTYYAKLNTGIPKLELFSQGLYYFINSLKFDPITLILTLGTILYIFIKREKKYISLVSGLVLYLLYIIYIGGDFMSGRFFSLPFITALIILSDIVSIKTWFFKVIAFVAVYLLMFLTPNPPVLSGISYSDKNANFLEEQGISDERGYYYSNASLWKAINGEKMPNHPMIETAKRLSETNEQIFLAGAIGFLGYYAGPNMFVMDIYALSDPFLSKFNVVKYDPIFGAAYEKKFRRKSPKYWRIGHFLRPLFPGYTLSLLKNTASFDDKNLNELFNEVKVITQGDIFSYERFSYIWKMNTGSYKYLVDQDKSIDYVETNFHDDLIRYKPDCARYYYNRASYNFRRNRYVESIPDFEKTISLEHNNGLAWYKLSIAQFYNKKFDKALLCYENAKKLGEQVDPEFEKVLFQKIKERNQPK
jgi:arabinofuranosyltransferase